MGIMDKIGGIAGGSNPIYGMLMSVFNQFGGVSGLMQRFQQNGQGHIAQSWLGDGQKLPIRPDQLQSTLGSENVERMSQQTGMPSNQLLEQLSRYLPGVIGKLTPGGKVPSGNVTEDQLKQGGIGELLSGFIGRKAG